MRNISARRWTAYAVTSIVIAATAPAALAPTVLAADIPSAITSVRIVEETVDATEAVTLRAEFALPNGSRRDDTVTLALPEQLWATEGTTFPLTSPDGSVVATGVVTDRKLVLTMTDYVESHVNVTGYAQVRLFIDTSTISLGSPTTIVFDVGATTQTDTFTVMPADVTSWDQHASKWLTYSEGDGDVAGPHTSWGIVAPRITGDRTGKLYTFVDKAQPGQSFVCDDPISLGRKTMLLMATGFDTYGSIVWADDGRGYVDWDKWDYSCTPEEIVVMFDTSAHAEYDGLIPYVMGYSTVATPVPATLTNVGEVIISGEYYSEVKATTSVGEGGGDGGSPVTGNPPYVKGPQTPRVAPKPPVRLRTFQVDTYRRTTPALARLATRIVADRRLTYREDRAFWGASSWEFVTVRVPDGTTSSGLGHLINAASQRSGDVRTASARVPVKKGPLVVAWELGSGATKRAPWGPHKTTPQRLVARS